MRHRPLLRSHLHDAAIAILRLDDTRLQVEQDVRNTLQTLAASAKQVYSAGQQVKLAERELEQSRDRFQAGVTNHVEVIQAQDGLARANDNQIAALYRFNQARADLARSVGQMEALYAK